MASMLTSASDDKAGHNSTGTTTRSSRRTHAPANEENASGTRFFLPKAGTNGNSLELGHEFASEGEARVEALKLGLTYYSVREWRPVADFAGKNPELKRESVIRKEEVVEGRE